MERAEGVEDGPLRVVALEDLAARHARLCWDLVDGKCVAPKFARDFLRMVELVRLDRMESIWREHRKAWFAATFGEAVAEIRRAIELWAEFLMTPAYSTDAGQACERCEGRGEFVPARATEMLARLGYC
jgi:hypothetical protein